MFAPVLDWLCLRRISFSLLLASRSRQHCLRVVSLLPVLSLFLHFSRYSRRILCIDLTVSYLFCFWISSRSFHFFCPFFSDDRRLELRDIFFVHGAPSCPVNFFLCFVVITSYLEWSRTRRNDPISRFRIRRTIGSLLSLVWSLRDSVQIKSSCSRCIVRMSGRFFIPWILLTINRHCSPRLSVSSPEFVLSRLYLPYSTQVLAATKLHF